MMFAFTSLGSKMDHYFNNGKGPPNSRIQGQSCHRHYSMLPIPEHSPKFMQLYIYDIEKDIQNRIHGIKYVLPVYLQSQTMILVLSVSLLFHRIWIYDTYSLSMFY